MKSTIAPKIGVLLWLETMELNLYNYIDIFAYSDQKSVGKFFPTNKNYHNSEPCSLRLHAESCKRFYWSAWLDHEAKISQYSPAGTFLFVFF